jgi:conjugal transfer pilus assembly protein TraL
MTLEIPRHIDDPPQLLLWRVDDLLPLLVALITGVLTDHLLLFLALGVVGVRLYGRYRESRPDGFVAHALYWAGLLPLAGRTCPNPFIRRFLP